MNEGLTEEDVDLFIEQEEILQVKEVANTTCDHYWIETKEQDPNSDMLSVQCKNCWAGCSLGSELKLEDGKMVRR